MGTNQCEGAQLSPWIFKFQTGAARTSQETRRSFGLRPSLRATRFTRPFIPLTRKDNSSRPSGRILQVGSCLTTRRQRMPQQPPRLSSGMSTGLPFTGPRRASTQAWPTCLGAAFAYGLGSTHPCTSAVHMEPFSTSALEDLTQVFATTTKICARGRSR